MGVESHEVSSFLVNRIFPPPAYHWGYAEGEASYIINSLEQTAHSGRFWALPDIFTRGPLFKLGVSQTES
jgi:hypothetical protein